VPGSPVSAAPTQPEQRVENASPALERRQFLKFAAVAGGAVAAVALGSVLRSINYVPPVTTQTAWPKLKVTNINSVQPLTPITFNYPLTNTPNILVKLGVKADNGVGPDGDIVAFSDVCQHLGCFYAFLTPGTSPTCNLSFKAAIPQGYCCCHGSQYDLAHGGNVIHGPAPRPVPQVKLELDQSTGDIFAVAMGAPTIFGHGPAGTTEPNLVLQYDLQGGTVVST
jgi:arsenite oxidase small subunit